MLIWKKILWLRERVREQLKWIERCGGSLAGYVENYGDPGVPPLDKHGKPKVIWVPTERQGLMVGWLQPCEHFEPDGRRVLPDVGEGPLFHLPYYARHSGDGGTKIWEADHNRLLYWEHELRELEARHHAPFCKANAMEQTSTGDKR